MNRELRGVRIEGILLWCACLVICSVIIWVVVESFLTLATHGPTGVAAGAGVTVAGTASCGGLYYVTRRLALRSICIARLSAHRTMRSMGGAPGPSGASSPPRKRRA